MKNIVEILSKKLKGTKLYSIANGECFYQGYTEHLGIECKVMEGDTIYFSESGKVDSKGECLLFPSKGMRDWDKFAWEKGDIVINNDGKFGVSFDGWKNDSYTEFICEDSFITYPNGKISGIRGKDTIYETKDFELSGLNYDIKSKDNDSFSTVKEVPRKKGDVLKLVNEEKFKGDIFCIFREFEKDQGSFWAVYYCDGRILKSDEVLFDTNCGWTKASEKESKRIKNYLEKVYGGKFNLETLNIEPAEPEHKFKPFEKIIVRDRDNDQWNCDFFSRMNKNFYKGISCCSWVQCLPYNEETSKLVGTSKSLEDIR